MAINPYEQYKKQSIMTMTQGEMIVKLYDECLRMIRSGILYINEQNIEKTNESLKKAHEIINYLRSILNFKYEISEDLSSLYDYYVRQIIKANVKKSTEPLEEILPMVTDLRNSFYEANIITQKEKARA